ACTCASHSRPATSPSTDSPTTLPTPPSPAADPVDHAHAVVRAAPRYAPLDPDPVLSYGGLIVSAAVLATPAQRVRSSHDHHALPRARRARWRGCLDSDRAA